MQIEIDEEQELRILLVEDKAHYHDIYRRTLEDEFAHVTLISAVDGASAKKVVSGLEDDLHLMILDYNLPDLSGEDLLDFFRAEEKFHSTPIMFLTGETDENLQGRLLAKGANEFVEKGAAPDVIIARIRVQLRNKLMIDDLAEKALSMEMFTAGVLHDLRNIETNVLGFCGILERDIKKEPDLQNRDSLLEDVDNLKAQIYRMNDYANSILKKVRLTQKTFDLKTVNLEPILEWVRSLLSVEGDFHLHQDTPLSEVVADGAMLKLVLLNICQNAVKYNRTGEICNVYVSEQSQSDSALICLEDNGEGVPEEELKSIFLPFHRASNNLQKEGMGLGLSMAARIVKKMNGKIWAENGTKGLKINLQLPLAGDS